MAAPRASPSAKLWMASPMMMSHAMGLTFSKQRLYQPTLPFCKKKNTYMYVYIYIGHEISFCKVINFGILIVMEIYINANLKFVKLQWLSGKKKN